MHAPSRRAVRARSVLVAIGAALGAVAVAMSAVSASVPPSDPQPTASSQPVGAAPSSAESLPDTSLEPATSSSASAPDVTPTSAPALSLPAAEAPPLAESPAPQLAAACDVVYDQYELVAGTSLTVPAPGVLGNDACPAFDPSTDVILLAETVRDGVVTLDPSGDGIGGFTFEPVNGLSQRFYYQLLDAETGVVLGGASVLIFVYAQTCNGYDDEYTPSAGDPFGGSSVIENDDICLGFDHVSLVSGPSHGSISMERYGTFSYVPDDGFVGEDTFSYVMDNAAGEALTLPTDVTLDVQPDFVEAHDDAYSVRADQVLEVPAPGVLGNDELPGLPILEPTWPDDAGDHPGIISISRDGSLDYYPDRDYAGTFTIDYELIGGDWTTYDRATITITVLPAPCQVRLENDTYAVAADGSLRTSSPGVLANDELCGNGWAVVPVEGPDRGTLTLAPDGGFVYEPEGGFVGTDSFVYEVQVPTVRGWAGAPRQVDPDYQATVTLTVSAGPATSTTTATATTTTTTTAPPTEPPATEPGPTVGPPATTTPPTTSGPSTPTTAPGRTLPATA